MIRSLLFEAVVPVPEGFYQLVGNVRKIARNTLNALQAFSLLADGKKTVSGTSTRELSRAGK